MSIVAHRTNVLAMYRTILRSAQNYPSVKREQILVEIKEDFRRNRSLSDEEQIDKAIMEAMEGLQALQRYSGHSDSPHFSVQL
mmetsp:Transcript_26328/g.73581  ORF Transcript_26328/g.73581 Transcript_26328/m.73581 type:complete len:83 (-) Transcript_26328:395-643(-)